MLSRAVNVFRKKKSRKSAHHDGEDDRHGTDTNASETETEPDDCSCHSEPVLPAGLSPAFASNGRLLQDSSPASSTEYFQDGPEQYQEMGGRRKKHSRKEEQTASDEVREECRSSSSIASSLLSTIRRARSRSRSRSIASSSPAAAGRSTSKLLPTSKSTLSSRNHRGGDHVGGCGDRGYGGTGSSASSALLHSDEERNALVSSDSFARDTKRGVRDPSEDHLRSSPTQSTELAGAASGSGSGGSVRQGDGKRQGLTISYTNFDWIAPQKG